MSDDTWTNVLEQAARKQHSADPGVQACWDLVTDGMRYGMVRDAADLADVLFHLRQRRDLTLEELTFEVLGDDLTVRLLGQTAVCRPEQMIDLLEVLRSHAL